LLPNARHIRENEIGIAAERARGMAEAAPELIIFVKIAVDWSAHSGPRRFFIVAAGKIRAHFTDGIVNVSSGFVSLVGAVRRSRQ
jgi:hypothetical protein